MKKWEYKKVHFRDEYEVDEDTLNKFGNDGWELVIYISGDYIGTPQGRAGVEIIFKREKSQG